MRAAVAVALLSAGCTISGPPIVPRKSGLVRLFQKTGGAGALTAEFTTDTCARRVVGPCDVVLCPDASPDAGATPTPSVGLISEVGLAQPLQLGPNPDGTYYAQTAGRLWNNMGERASVHAAGAAIAGFDAAVIAPNVDVFLSPTLVGQSHDRAADLSISWQGTADVHVSIDTTNAGVHGTVDCRFDGPTGAASVSGTALSLLPTGFATVAAFSSNRQQLLESDYVIVLVAEEAGHTTGVGDFGGPIVFQ